eukprot:TRINITY_DN5167_c0_g1_i5.p1 TRINITY_DN5167_c0_g1~~TRINITY_DN5167_c0_g1_i5.p1  ORF type:complete len:253 (-),score=44.98 TRINITY_DN5167_c0_g1_i5:163-921(-)
MWDVEKGDLTETIKHGPGMCVEHLDVCDDIVACAVRDENKDDHMIVWNSQSLVCLHDVLYPDMLYDIKIHHNILVTCGYSIMLWNLENLVHPFANFGEDRGNIIWCLDVGFDGNVISTGHFGGGLGLCDVRSKSFQHLIQAHNSGINHVKLLSDTILTASDDTTVKVFDKRMMLCRKTLTSHLKSVYNVNMMENIVISTSCDRSVRLWDIDTGNCFKTLWSHRRPVTSLDVVNNQTFVTGSWDQTVKLWVAQ